MKKGYLSQYFKGVAVKTLSAVESDRLKSNQHEFNGVKGLVKMLGKPQGRVEYAARFLYLTDNETNPIREDGFLTWYDARERARVERGVMRTEYRLYFPSNPVVQNANPGDILIIAQKTDGYLLAIVAEKETSIASQIIWLFGITDIEHSGFFVRKKLETSQDRIAFASRVVLEGIGVAVETTEEKYLDEMMKCFGQKFPTTKIFSEYSRSTLTDLDVSGDPDYALLAIMEREEILFRTLEKHIIEERLSTGFGGDVESFISFSLSVQNRRKSRTGYAFENHLEYIFRELAIRYSRAAVTENKSKPDFLFPGEAEYHNSCFSALNLTMLGVKSTCKDRWRQVLAEADRIEEKHLLTLEAAISSNQTDEMNSKKLQLVVPGPLHETYTASQQKWLMDFVSFIELVRRRQFSR